MIDPQPNVDHIKKNNVQSFGQMIDSEYEAYMDQH